MARNKKIAQRLTDIIFNSTLFSTMSGAEDVKILAVSTGEVKARMLNKMARGFHLSGFRYDF